MKLGLALLIAHNFIEILVAKGILLPNGDFADNSVVKDFELASAFEQELINRGVVIDEKVQKVIKLLPAIIAMIGIE